MTRTNAFVEPFVLYVAIFMARLVSLYEAHPQ